MLVERAADADAHDSSRAMNDVFRVFVKVSYFFRP
jgi:hypothetical protein